ncbi:MAG: phage DNA packaging protein J [Muribaculaceae bacterium]|nr:phage DNA packaging protein J [Muribaculaceae bacterium]
MEKSSPPWSQGRHVSRPQPLRGTKRKAQ